MTVRKLNEDSFSVGVEHGVSETVADAQGNLRRGVNAWSYLMFASSID